MNDIRMKISPPWVTFINMLIAQFDGDPQIACNVDYSASDPSIALACNNGDKVAALQKLLPTDQWYGGVTLRISIDGPVSNRAFTSKKELFEVAFEKNPAFAYAVSPANEGYHYIDFTYVVFKNCVVQFFNDNLDDPHGVVSMLYQDIAKEVFYEAGLTGVSYCTDVERKLGMPLGEWP